MRLRRNQLCPIHHSLFCCGRGAIPREKRQRQMGVRRIQDPHHPRGYRELRSDGEMRKLLDRKIAAQRGKCALCNEQFTDYGDIVPDHIHPRGMGGGWRDDHPENIQAVSSGGAMGKGIEQRVILDWNDVYLTPWLDRSRKSANLINIREDKEIAKDVRSASGRPRPDRRHGLRCARCGYGEFAGPRHQ